MTNEPDGPFTEEDEHPVSEFDNEPPDEGDEATEHEMQAALAEAQAEVARPAIKPLSPSTPYADPPLWSETEKVRVRVARDGYAELNGKRVFVGRSVAGGTVNAPKAWFE